MNKTNAAKFLPLVQALANGATIQYKSKHPPEWFDTNEPAFSGDVEYRIKPAPVIVERWHTLYRDGHLGGNYKTKESAMEWKAGDCVCLCHIILTDGVPSAEFLPLLTK
jgi:hypothetical protein